MPKVEKCIFYTSIYRPLYDESQNFVNTYISEGYAFTTIGANPLSPLYALVSS